MPSRTRRLLASAAGLAAVALGLGACDQLAVRGKRDADTPSGLPVPRYVSLKFGEVVSRSGPSEENRIVATYRARGLPVQVVAETDEWRRICDPEGGLAWVKSRLLASNRTVIRLRPGTAALLRKPIDGTPAEGLLASRVVAGLDHCARGWCRVTAGGRTGWVAEQEVWGVDPRPQCRG